MRTLALVGILALAAALSSAAQSGSEWVAAWTGSVQGPYPSGNALAQPDLRLAFPDASAGAHDQTFRLMVRPDVWSGRARIRLSNAFGTKPVTFDDIYVGVQTNGASVVGNRRVAFRAQGRVTVAPGAFVWSDGIELAQFPGGTAALAGRRLAVSFHIVGDSGPMTWHAKALTTSYITAPGAGSKSQVEDDGAFPYSTTSWYFLDAVDMDAGAHTQAIVALGDSITDGTASTLNGDDRWPDILSRRLHKASGDHWSIVDAGIGGNRVVTPATYSATTPFSGGPSAASRLERDVLSLSGVRAVIWLEGINDFSRDANTPASDVQTAMTQIVGRIRARLPGVRVIGATVTSALNSTNAAHGSAEEDRQRRQLNDFIRTSKVFDGVVDFDAVTLDPRTGGLRAEFVPESTTGGPGDRLHPNRAGYLAMGMSIDLALFPVTR